METGIRIMCHEFYIGDWKGFTRSAGKLGIISIEICHIILKCKITFDAE